MFQGTFRNSTDCIYWCILSFYRKNKAFVYKRFFRGDPSSVQSPTWLKQSAGFCFPENLTAAYKPTSWLPQDIEPPIPKIEIPTSMCPVKFGFRKFSWLTRITRKIWDNLAHAGTFSVFCDSLDCTMRIICGKLSTEYGIFTFLRFSCFKSSSPGCHYTPTKSVLKSLPKQAALPKKSEYPEKLQGSWTNFRQCWKNGEKVYKPGISLTASEGKIWWQFPQFLL